MPGAAIELFPEIESDLGDLYTTGLIPSQGIKELVARGHLRGSVTFTEQQIQPVSIDLRLGSVAYQVRSSFLPTENAKVIGKVDDLKLAEIDLSAPTLLKKGQVYIIPLMEELNLPANVSAKANPKSTIGRIDVFTRLIADYGTEFDRIPRGYGGNLYVEVVPRTFNIVVHAGTRLNQLRFVRGNFTSSDTALNALHKSESLVYTDDDQPGKAVISKGLWVTI